MNNPISKLSSMLSECNVRDDLVMKHAKVAEEAIAGWEKAEAESVFLKQELDEALQKRAAARERIHNLDAALKECMQQLRCTRDEQEHRIHDAVIKTSKEHGKERMFLEDKLEETSKKLAKLSMENYHLSKVLQTKEKLIENLSHCKSQAEANVNAVMSRLHSKEKANASLKYNVHLLEKEHEMQNKERELNLRSADASSKQNLESIKRITKLEKECQRLRLLVRKRMPGPVTLAAMKSENEMLGQGPEETGNIEFDLPMTNGMAENIASHNSLHSPSRSISFLIEQLCAMGDEHKSLKETVTRKNDEIRSLKSIGSHVEVLRTVLSHDLPRASTSEAGYEDEVSCAGSWPSSLVSELELFRNGKSKGSPSIRRVGISDISLMDDFVEMEKLAGVSTDRTCESSDIPKHDNKPFMGLLEAELCTQPSEASGKELIPVRTNQPCSGEMTQQIQSNDILIGKYPTWLQNIMRLVLRQNHIAQKNPDEILKEIGIALANVSGSGSNGVGDGRKCSTFSSSSCTLSKSIQRIIELIVGIDQTSLTDYNSQILSEDKGHSLSFNSSKTSTGYMVRVFQWKNSELGDVLQRFVDSCNDLLNGKADLENFARELCSALDWTLNHCFSIQDVSSMRHSIKKHFDWDESESDTELEDLMSCPPLEAHGVLITKEQSSCSPTSLLLNGQNNLTGMEGIQLNTKQENRRLKQKLTNMESVQKDLEVKLQLATEQTEKSMIQIREFEETIGSLQAELKASKESKRMVEDQFENYKLLHEHPDAQLTAAGADLNKVQRKSFSLDAELKKTVNCCHELEATCLKLQLQLESVTKKALINSATDQARQLPTDWEFTEVSEKMAECQETILSLGKQLKALTSPKDVALLYKAVSATPSPASKSKTRRSRSSLLEQMLAEDNTKPKNFKSPEIKEIICTIDGPSRPLTCPSNVSSAVNGLNSQVKSQELVLGTNETKYEGNPAAGQALAVAYSKKCGGGVNLLRKLVIRRNRGSKKKSLTMVA